MSRSVVVVDYGSGNVLSVCRALEASGASVTLTAEPSAILAAERLVLPGVGAFGDCVSALAARDLPDVIRAFVASERPFLGICVGMQMLLDHSEEFGGAPGLGFIAGKVRQIPTEGPDGISRKIPHIGWAELLVPAAREPAGWTGSILASTPVSTPCYFVHSFNAQPQDERHILAVARYDGVDITAAVQMDNLFGTQFHPEKSGAAGLRILAQFLGL